MKYLFSGDIQYIKGRKQKRGRWKKAIALFLICLFIVFSIGSFIMIDDTFRAMFARADRPAFTYYQTYEDVADDYKRTEVEFLSEEHLLKGYLYGPKKAEQLVVISHGMGGGADSYLQEILYFVDRGYKVFAFDNTGSYDSEGDGIGGLSQSLIDLDAALNYIESDETLKKMPILLYGHSWGGYAVTAVLNYHHNIVAAVSVAGYNSPMEMMMDWCKEEMGLFAYIEYPYLWIYQKVLFGGASNLSAVDGINGSGIPVMLIHGTEDQTVAYDGPGIISHKEKITNPNVVYFSRSEKGQNGHSNLFRPIKSSQYLKEKKAEYQELSKKYGGKIPEDILKEWEMSIDKKKTSKLDEIVMRDIYEFYEEALASA